MKKSRRTAVLSFILFVAASASSAQTSAAVYLPKPHPPIDDRFGIPKPPVDCRLQPCDPGPFRPMEGVSEKAAQITAAVGEGHIMTASAGLDSLFSGIGVKAGSKNTGSSDDAVYAGAWKTSPRLSQATGKNGEVKTPFVTRDNEVPAPIFRKVDCGDKNGCKSELGREVDDATKPLQDALDRLGDKLRDRNDDKLREGTQRQRDAEKQQKEKQEKRERERPIA